MDMNRNNLKIIIAVALGALILSGIFIIMDSDESDAATYSADDLFNNYTSPVEITDSTVTISDYSGKLFGITQTITASPSSFSLSVGGQQSVTLNSTWGSQTGTKTLTFKRISSSTTSYTCYLEYNANGGSGAPSTQSYTGNSMVSHDFTISSSTPTRSGYTFLGWSTSSVAASASYNPGGTISVGYNSTRTLYAVWQQNPTYYTCYLYYNANGGSGAPSTDSYTGTSTSSHIFTVSSTTPTKSGYTFKGWSTSSSATSASYTGGSTISVGYNSSKTLYAVWEQQATTITITVYKGNWASFKLLGVDSSSITSSSKTYTVNSGQSIDVDWYGASSTSSGSESAGYITTTSYDSHCYNMVKATSLTYPGGGSDSMTAESGGKYYPANQMNSSTSTTYYFKVAYNANGGSGAPSTTDGGTSSSTSKSVTLSSTVPTRSGYTFLGWSTSSTATSASYSAGTSYSFSYGTTNLYAVWKEDIPTYTISASSSTGGNIYIKNATTGDTTTTGSSKSLTVSRGDSIKIYAVSSTGYHLWYWWDASNEEDVGQDNPFTFTANGSRDLIANFDKTVYTMYASLNSPSSGGGNVKITNNTRGTTSSTGTDVSLSAYYGDSVTFTAVPDQGYMVEGWTNWGSAYGGQDELNITVSVEGSESFEVEYSARSYTVTFNANGGTTPKDSTIVTYNSTYGTLPTPTRTNYSFDGWYTQQTGGTLVTSSTKVTTASNHILWAHWTLISFDHKVAYAPNGGSGSMTDTVVTDNNSGGSSVTLQPCTFTKTGYHFTGWSVNGTVKQPGDTVSVNGGSTVTATAQWAANALTIGSIEKQYAVVGHSITFTASASSDPAGASITYSKSNASSGLTVSISGSSVTMSSNQVGTYTFTLTASATNYTSSSTTVTVQFVPVLEFTNSPSVGIIGE